MTRILFISPEFLPTGGTSAEARVNAKLVTAGLNAGWKIDVIAEEQQIPSSHYEDDMLGYNLSDIVSLVHVPDRRTLNHLLLRIRSQILFRGMFSLYGNAGGPLAFRKGLELIRANRYDVIMSRSLPEYAHLPALMLARKTGIPWIANWNDPAPMRLLPHPYGDGPSGRPSGGRLMSSLRHKSLQRFFSAIAREATWHTFPCERLREYMIAILGRTICEKSSVIPHIALESLENVSDHNYDVFSICHSGLLYKRDPRVFMKGVRLFLDAVKPTNRINISFLGADSNKITKDVVDFGLEGVVCSEPACAYHLAVQRLRMASVTLIIEAQMKEGIFLPSKLVDCAQTGRPILAVSPLNGTISDLIGKYGGGIVADCFSPESVAVALGTLYGSWKRGNLDLEYGSQCLAEQFSAKRVITAYEELFSSVLPLKK